MSKFVLILGAEGSGTRLVARLLLTVEGACGTNDHFQGIDCVFRMSDAEAVKTLKAPPYTTVPLILMRRSMPHGGQWSPLGHMGDIIKAAGHQLYVVVIVRDTWACIEAQRRAGHVPEKRRGYANYRRAYTTIFDWIHSAGLQENMIIVTYEALALDQYRCARNTLGELLGVKLPEKGFPSIFNGNSKYYDKQDERQNKGSA